MIKLGDRAMPHPYHSMRYSRRWGLVVAIHTDKLYDLTLQFDDSMTQNYSANEVMDEETVKMWGSQGTVRCKVCGKDITGDFSWICEDCLYPIREETLDET